MNNSLTNPGTITPQAREAFRAALSRIIGDVVFVVVFLALALWSGAWQLLVASAFLFLTLVLAVIGAGLIRRNRVELGAWWVILGLFPAILCSPFLISGLGLVAGIGVVMLTVVTAAQTLPARRVSWAVVMGVAVGITTLLLDMLLPTTQRLTGPPEVLAPAT